MTKSKQLVKKSSEVDKINGQVAESCVEGFFISWKRNRRINMNDKKRVFDQQETSVKKSKTESNSDSNDEPKALNNNLKLQKSNVSASSSNKLQIQELDVPKGLKYISDFLTKEEEKLLMDKIDAGEWSNQLKRRVQHYGYIYDYKNRVIDQSMKTKDIPEFVGFVVDRLSEIGVYPSDKKPDQLIINGWLMCFQIADKHRVRTRSGDQLSCR